MPDYLRSVLGLVFFVLGGLLGYMVRPRDWISMAAGYAIGVATGLAIIEETGWYLLGIPLFAVLLAMRREKTHID